MGKKRKEGMNGYDSFYFFFNFIWPKFGKSSEQEVHASNVRHQSLKVPILQLAA